MCKPIAWKVYFNVICIQRRTFKAYLLMGVYSFTFQVLHHIDKAVDGKTFPMIEKTLVNTKRILMAII